MQTENKTSPLPVLVVFYRDDGQVGLVDVPTADGHYGWFAGYTMDDRKVALMLSVPDADRVGSVKKIARFARLKEGGIRSLLRAYEIVPFNL